MYQAEKNTAGRICYQDWYIMRKAISIIAPKPTCSSQFSKSMEEFCKAELENVFPSVKSIYPWTATPEASKTGILNAASS